MDWLVEPFEFSFMQRALLGGVLAAVTTSLVGTWVVVRGMSFMGDALAHGVLPGIAVAYLVGFDLTIGAAAGALVMVAGINLVTRRTRLAEDTGIGLLFVGMLAVGVVIVSRSRSFATDLTAFLFGDVLAVGTGDLWLQAAAAAVALAGVLLFYRAFLALAFNEEKAAILGLRPGSAHIAMLTLIAVAILSSFRTVGTLLVFGLLVAPPATATLVVRRVPMMMVTAVAFGILAVLVGLEVSFHYDTASGATIAAAAVAQFFLVLTLREVGTRVRERRAVGTA